MLWVLIRIASVEFYEEISKIITYHQISNTHLISSAVESLTAWPSGRVSDLGARGRGLIPFSAVLCPRAKTHLLP